MVELKLATLFKQIADSELSAEKNRHKIVGLLECEDHYLFKSLQMYEKDYLVREDIAQFLRNAGHKLELEDAGILISAYDIDNDGKMSLHEFLNFLLPHSGIITPSKKISKDSTISDDFKRELANFIVMEIDALKKIQQSIKELASDPKWSPSSGFSLIDAERSGSLDLTNLINFFRKGHVSLDYDSVLALCRRLNRGVTGKVSYSSFLSWFDEPIGRKSLKHSAYDPVGIETKNILDRIGTYLRSKSPQRFSHRGGFSDSGLGFRRSIDPSIHDRHAYKRYYEKYHRLPESKQVSTGYVSKLTQSTHELGAAQRALNLSAYRVNPIYSDSKLRPHSRSPNRYELLRMVDRALERSNDNIERAVSQEYEERVYQTDLNRLVGRALARSYDNLAASGGLKSSYASGMKRSYFAETATKRDGNGITGEDPIESLVQSTLEQSLQVRIRSALQDRDTGARLSPEAKRVLTLSDVMK